MASSSEGKKLKFCCVCQSYFNSDAELAIHEFSKRHCDNLLRLSKNKPVKQKTAKPVPNKSEPEKNAVEVVHQPINVSLYGYFNSGDLLSTQPKEFNTEYDPYLQKLAENPFKVNVEKETPAFPTTNVTSFSKSKKKKKKSCQICNVSMMNIPEYEAHMKSAQHVWKLKVTGMGVSAHFVKASTDLHTIDKKEEGIDEEGKQEDTDGKVAPAPVPISPGELFCDLCGMLLNSKQQFDAHLSGKTHLDNVQRKQGHQTPSPNQLFCYSCKLSLTNIQQFNEHKGGKKHRSRCRSLMREGYTIPPEERPPDMAWNIVACSPVKYPDGYQQDVVNKQMAVEKGPNKVVEKLNHTNNTNEKVNLSESERPIKTAIIFHAEKKNETGEKCEEVADISNTDTGLKDIAANSVEVKKTEIKDLNENEVVKDFQCSLCDVKFPNQPPFELHLNSEAHAHKLVELKKSGMAFNVILTKLMDDRKFIRPDRYNRRCCGVCATVSQNTEESERHLKSLLHKYALADYTKKRRLEIHQTIEANEEKLYCCKLCEESWPKLTEYNAHLHSQKHKTLLWKENQKKYNAYKWPHLKFKRFGSWRGRMDERNPGVRTKVGGIATDLKSGIVETVPNLEVIEPKIDNSKNVRLGLSVPSKNIKKKKSMMPARRRPGMMNFKLPPPERQGLFAPLGPYIPPPSLMEAPTPSFLRPMPPPRMPRYHPYPRPNPMMHHYPQRPYYRPTYPPRFSNWGSNYPARRYY